MCLSRAALGALAVLGVLAPRPLTAQVCAGFPALRGARFRVAASAASYTYAYARSLEASFAAGRRLYASFSFGIARDSELDAETYDVGFAAGADIPTGSHRRLFLCPTGELVASYGPYDFLLGRDDDYSRLSLGLGIGVAAAPVRSRWFSVLPTGNVTVVGLLGHRRFYSPPAPGRYLRSKRDTHVVLGLGVGIVVGDVLTVRPRVTVPLGLVPAGAPDDEVAVPFGREEGERSFSVTIGLTLGRGKSP